jgi:hypothetical protein
VLTEEKLYDIGTRLEHAPRKPLKRIVQATEVSESSARTAKQLVKLRPYKATVIHALQPRDPANRVNFCSWFLQSVDEGEIDPQLTFFSDEAWFFFYLDYMHCGHSWPIVPASGDNEDDCGEHDGM